MTGNGTEKKPVIEREINIVYSSFISFWIFQDLILIFFILGIKSMRNGWTGKYRLLVTAIIFIGYNKIWIKKINTLFFIGKGGKNRRRGKNENENEKRELVFKEDGQGKFNLHEAWSSTYM